MESRQWMIAEAIAHTAGPDTVVFRRDIELLATDPVWERAHGDPDTLAAIWCSSASPPYPSSVCSTAATRNRRTAARLRSIDQSGLARRACLASRLKSTSVDLGLRWAVTVAAMCRATRSASLSPFMLRLVACTGR